MLEHDEINHKGLKLLARDGDTRGIQVDWVPRLKRILGALNVATSPGELNVPGWNLHELKGDRKGTFSVKVTANWRLTFEWGENGPRNVNLEDYHGR